MSKHVGRKRRWTQQDAKRYTSALGQVVYKGDGWYAILDYRIRVEERHVGPARWDSFSKRLGPFKRPRNAMVALEEEATVLKNRHGENILFGGQLWAEGHWSDRNL